MIAIVSLLYNLPKQDENDPKSLEKLADDTQQYVQSLVTLGVNVSDEMVVVILQEKLSSTMRVEWEKSLTRDQFPNLDQMIEFLDRSALTNALEVRNRVNICEIPAKRRKFDHQKSVKVLVTTKQTACLMCQKDHAL